MSAIIYAFLLAYALAAPAPAVAKDKDKDKAWPVTHLLRGKPDKETGKPDKSEDVSGIACTSTHDFPRACLVIDDNLQAAQFVALKDGEIVAGDPLPLIDNMLGKKALELDGEGVAYADGMYYVIGSHGHPRDSKGKLDPKKDRDEIEARIAAASQIVRFKADADGVRGDIERTGKLRDIIKSHEVLGKHAEQRLDKNGVTIEGIAVKDGVLFAGFRGPSLKDGRAPVLAVPLGTLFGSEPAKPKFFRLPLGEKRGVRDLAVYRDGILVLAGPTGDKPKDYSVFWWDGASENIELLGELAKVTGKKGRKAEAVLPLDETSSGLRVLIMFDSEPEGAPIDVVVRKPTRSR